MKALILAAGRGTRLGELTLHRPKPMLPIAGVPMLGRIMRAIHDGAGIDEFVLVTGYLGNIVEEYFGDGSQFGWRVDYVVQDPPRGVGHAVDIAAPLLSTGPFLLTYGDIMMDAVDYDRAVRLFDAGGVDIVDGLNWVDDPWAGSAVYVDEDFRVKKIVEKPPKGTSTSNWNSAGLYVLPPLTFAYTSRLELSPRGEYEFPDAVGAMIADGLHVRGLPLTGRWRDVGTPADYELINREYGVTKE